MDAGFAGEDGRRHGQRRFQQPLVADAQRPAVPRNLVGVDRQRFVEGQEQHRHDRASIRQAAKCSRVHPIDVVEHLAKERRALLRSYR
jgi:hypothetical protein